MVVALRLIPITEPLVFHNKHISDTDSYLSEKTHHLAQGRVQGMLMASLWFLPWSTINSRTVIRRWSLVSSSVLWRTSIRRCWVIGHTSIILQGPVDDLHQKVFSSRTVVSSSVLWRTSIRRCWVIGHTSILLQGPEEDLHQKVFSSRTVVSCRVQRRATTRKWSEVDNSILYCPEEDCHSWDWFSTVEPAHDRDHCYILVHIILVS